MNLLQPCMNMVGRKQKIYILQQIICIYIFY